MSTSVPVRNVDDLFAFIPVALGFHPHDSLVAVTYTSTGAQTHIRLDLTPGPTSDDADAALCTDLAHVLADRGTTSCALVAYTADLARAGTVIDLLAGALADVGVTVRHTLATTPRPDVGLRDGDRWWYHLHSWLPLAGTSDPAAHPLALQAAFDGRYVAATRDALAATLTCDPVAAARVRHHLTRALAHHENVTGTRAGQQLGRRWLTRTLARHRAHPDRPLPDRTTARALVTLSDPTTARAVAGQVTADTAASNLTVFGALARRAPDHWAAAPATLAGLAAAAAGNGALASIAADVALAANPTWLPAHDLRRTVHKPTTAPDAGH